MFLGAIFARPRAGVAQAAVETVAEKVAAGTARQQQWLAATLSERVRLSEALGEDGARAMAKAKGFESLYDGVGRTLPQGPDQVYRATDGRVIVYEAKGGSGQLGHAYGHPQGSTEWAVESAKRVLRSANAGKVEQEAARKILEAAAQGRLEVHVIRTKHVLGEPTAAVLEGVTKSTENAAQLARSALDDIVRAGANVTDDVARAGIAMERGAIAGVNDAARAAGHASSVKVASKALVVVGVAVDASVRVNDAVVVEQRFAEGKISQQQREVEHAKNAAGMAGGWSGAIAGAEGGAIAGGIGGPWGAAAGGVIGGIGGYFGGEAAAAAAAEWGMNRLHDAGTTVRGTWNWALGY